jgi:adenylate kinase
MRNIFQSIKSRAKRSGVGIATGAAISLAIIVSSAIIPIQANAEEADGPYVIIIGAPGSGKSTASVYISEPNSVPIIEVGQLLRDEVATASKATASGKPGSKRAQASAKRIKNIEAAKEKLATGELVDGQSVDAAVAASVLSPAAANGFVLDGYPGSVAQAEFLDALLAARGIVPIVIYLDVPDEVALARMKSRGRVDDEHGFAKKRLEVFRTNMAPLLDFYEDGGLYTVDATREISDVQKQIDKVLVSK